MLSSFPDPDRNLLFGVLAVRLDFISLDRLITAVNSQAAGSGRPLGQVLVERGDLTPDRRDALEAMVGEHLADGGATLVTTHGAYAEPPVRTKLLELA